MKIKSKLPEFLSIVLIFVGIFGIMWARLLTGFCTSSSCGGVTGFYTILSLVQPILAFISFFVVRKIQNTQALSRNAQIALITLVLGIVVLSSWIFWHDYIRGFVNL